MQADDVSAGIEPTEPAPGHGSRRLGWALAGSLLIALACLWRGAPPEVVPADAPADVGSGGRAFEALQRLADGLGPHPAGTQENAKLRGRLIEELARVGLEADVQEAFCVNETQRAAGYVRNVVARIEGTGAGDARLAGPGQAILLMAHYDSVGAGPGVSDDLAGCAALLEVARVLRDPARRPSRDVILLFNDGEEHGLLGATAFAGQHEFAGDVGAVVNVEARGTGGPSRMFETGSDNDWIATAFARIARRPSTTSVSTEVYRRMPNDTDYTVFRERGINGLNFAYIGGVSRYHTPLDDLAHLDPRSLQHHVTNALDAVRALDDVHLRAPGEGHGDAVFSDVLSLRAFALRVGGVRVLAILALALAGLGGYRAVRDGVVRPERVLVALVLAPVVLGLTLVSGWAAGALVELAAGAPMPWRARPAPVLVGLVGAALAGAALGGGLVGRIVRASEAAHAVGIALGILALLSALFLPGGSFLFVPPALLAGAFLGLARHSGDRATLERRFQRQALWVALLGALLWAPVTAALYPAFGATPPLVSAVPLGAALALGVAAWTLFALPLLASGWRGTGAMLAVLGVLTVGFAVAMGAALPSATPDVPGHLNVVYVDEPSGPDERSADWLLVTRGDPVPSEVTALAEFEPHSSGHWWSGRSVAAAPAPVGLLPLPEIEDVSWGGDEGRTVRLRLRSPAGGQQMTVGVHGAERWSVEGQPLPLSGITLVGTPPEGWQLELRLAPRSTIALAVQDRVLAVPPALAAGRELIDARPDERVPIGHGDGALLSNTFQLSRVTLEVGEEGDR